VVRSVANLTRADAHAFLDFAARVPLETTVRGYRLEAANNALDDPSFRPPARRGGAASVKQTPARRHAPGDVAAPRRSATCAARCVSRAR